MNRTGSPPGYKPYPSGTNQSLENPEDGRRKSTAGQGPSELFGLPQVSNIPRPPARRGLDNSQKNPMPIPIRSTHTAGYAATLITPYNMPRGKFPTILRERVSLPSLTSPDHPSSAPGTQRQIAHFSPGTSQLVLPSIFKTGAEVCPAVFKSRVKELEIKKSYAEACTYQRQRGNNQNGNRYIDMFRREYNEAYKNYHNVNGYNVSNAAIHAIAYAIARTEYHSDLGISEEFTITIDFATIFTRAFVDEFGMNNDFKRAVKYADAFAKARHSNIGDQPARIYAWYILETGEGHRKALKYVRQLYQSEGYSAVNDYSYDKIRENINAMHMRQQQSSRKPA